MNRDQIGETMYNLGRFFPEYGDFLRSITDSPFQEEIWQVLESKNFKDIWELIAYMEA